MHGMENYSRTVPSSNLKLDKILEETAMNCTGYDKCQKSNLIIVPSAKMEPAKYTVLHCISSLIINDLGVGITSIFATYIMYT